MSANTWVQALSNISADGTALTNNTAETSILNALHKYTLAANVLDAVGKKMRLYATGRISTVVTTPGTLTLRLKFGSVAVFNSGALSLNTTAQTNVPWILNALLEARTVGSGTAATLFGMGTWESHAVIASPAPTAGGCGTHVLPYNAAPAVGAGFDSTAAQVIDLTAQWSVANASNSIQCHLFSLEMLN